MLKYVIYADEAWTQTKPLYRYHCFFGGFISTSSRPLAKVVIASSSDLPVQRLS